MAQEALKVAKESFGPDHPNLATSLNILAELYRAQGQYAAAEPLYQQALAIREKALGPDHPDVATSLNNLAELYRAQGQYAAAEPLYKRSLAIREKALGPDHPHVAAFLNNLTRWLGSSRLLAKLPDRRMCTGGDGVRLAICYSPASPFCPSQTW